MAEPQNDNPLDVLAVIRAPIEQYPPTAHQIAIMAEAGLRVGVVEAWHPDYAMQEFSGQYPVDRFRLVRHRLNYKEPAVAPHRRLAQEFTFRQGLVATLRKRSPRVVIAYDPPAMDMLGPIWKRDNAPRVIWHFHELFQHGAADGLMARLAYKFSDRWAHRADMVVFSDRHRAEIFAERAKLVQSPEVVCNCPRLMHDPPSPILDARLAERGFSGRPVVYFHGWMGPSRCLETLIRSMPLWPSLAVLTLVGPIEASYQRSLTVLAAEYCVADRLMFVESVPHKIALGLAAGASVGISLVAAGEPNWTYSAGAVNKRFEYMAVGLPQVSNIGPGMKEIIERTHCGLLTDSTSPGLIGQAIERILADAPLQESQKANARAAHLNEYNYERQFAPVLSRIQSWAAEE